MIRRCDTGMVGVWRILLGFNEVARRTERMFGYGHVMIEENLTGEGLYNSIR